MNPRRFIPVVVVAAVLLSGCTGSLTPAAAIVNGVKITQDALQHRYERNLALADPSQASQITAPSAVDQRAAFIRSVLSSMILQQIIERYAVEHHVRISTAEINKELNQEISQLGRVRFERELRRRGLSVGDVRESIREFLLQNKVQTDITKGLPSSATPDQINQFLNRWLERKLATSRIEVNPQYGAFDRKKVAVCRIVSTAGDLAPSCGQPA